VEELITTPSRKMASNIYTIKEQLALATALPPRTTEDVIADLQVKRLRPVSEHSSSKRHQNSAAPPTLEEPKPIVPKSQYVEEWISGVDQTEQEQDEGGYIEDEGDAEKDDVGPSTKLRKITERKRRQNAIADSHIQTALQKSLKQGFRVKLEDEAQQSARWLINQSESHQIISTPRAYQTELFEKAKEKNIIAVLDTGELNARVDHTKLIAIGSGKTLIAVLLLRHTFAQELEDRAMDKKNRISFFLV
jgi:endoribonuclease Dicer